MVIGIYGAYAKKYETAIAKKQGDLIMHIMTSLNQNLLVVSDSDTPVLVATAVANINSNINPPTRLISQRVIPTEMITSPVAVHTLWGGNVTFAATTIDLTPLGALGLVPAYEITLNNVPPTGCSKITNNPKLLNISDRIRINGINIKIPGSAIVNPSTVAAACNNANNVVAILGSSFKYGIEAVVSSNAPARLKPKEGKYFIAPPGTVATSLGGAAGSCGPAAWNAVSQTCECGAGAFWDGSLCVPINDPNNSGFCQLGQGWNMVTRSCQPLIRGSPATVLCQAGVGCVASIAGASVPQVYQAGRAIPSNVLTPAQNTTSIETNCNGGARPTFWPGSIVANNPAGNFDGKNCQMCIVGVWDGDRCVTP